MKKVVLVLDGVVGEIFLTSVLEKYFSNNLYIVIVKDPQMIPEKPPSAFSFYQFDPTSEFHLTQTLQEHQEHGASELGDVFLILQDPAESAAVFTIMRKLCKEARIVTLAHKQHALDSSAKAPQDVASNQEHQPDKKDDHTITIDEASIVAPAKCPYYPAWLWSGQRRDHASWRAFWEYVCLSAYWLNPAKKLQNHRSLSQR